MQVRTETDIAAPIERVWDVISDFGAYPEWNPVITRIDGRCEEGADLRVRFAQPGGRSTLVKPRVVRVELGRLLRWRSQLFGRWLFSSEQTFELQGLEPERTRLRLGLDFTGALAQRYSGMLPSTARSFVIMNQALEDRVLGQKRSRGAARRRS